ncbi:MAG: adenosylcobinamide-GDP ribazoletransferase [Burkholderiales bacterium]|nr:adenosylcobinamide-GDP ribazoletransferase [Burkholderiales bacterium]
MARAWIRSRIDETRLALILLTRLPVGRLNSAPPLSAAAWAYPLAGAVVGIVCGVAFLSAQWLGLLPLPAAIISVAVGVVTTGGMHEDGLADLADGFGGGGDRARKLEIMRDSRVGSYGVIALSLALFLRSVLLAEVLPGHHPIFTLIAVGALARAPLPFLMRILPAARDDGLGHSAAFRIGTVPAMVGGMIGLLLAALFLPAYFFRTIFASVAAAVMTGYLARCQIGGFTGDVLGAAQIACELAVLSTLASG